MSEEVGVKHVPRKDEAIMVAGARDGLSVSAAFIVRNRLISTISVSRI